MTTPKVSPDLRTILAKLYTDSTSARRVAADAGLDQTRINFDGSAINTWHNILSEADKVNQVQHLVDIALSEYPSNPQLISCTRHISIGYSLTIDKLERIVHENDMLSFEWLEGALTVGKSIARLIVPQYKNGVEVGIHYYGTGWLIGQQHLITNHHVINARSNNEPNAFDIDLKLQSVNMQIQFDYTSRNASSEDVNAVELSAWSAHNMNEMLDYAIVRLDQPLARTPLTLAPKALNEYMINRGLVNIIQHPNGQPKMIGIRNNQINELTKLDLSYFTDTEGGSSGSPVCNDDWNVVALHRRWRYLPDGTKSYQGKPARWDNQGTRIDRIIEDLELNHPMLWQEINAKILG